MSELMENTTCPRSKVVEYYGQTEADGEAEETTGILEL